MERGRGQSNGNINSLMGGMNAKTGMDNPDYEQIMGKQWTWGNRTKTKDE